MRSAVEAAVLRISVTLGNPRSLIEAVIGLEADSYVNFTRRRDQIWSNTGQSLFY